MKKSNENNEKTLYRLIFFGALNRHFTVVDFEHKFKFLNNIGMLRRKENCHSQAECYV